MKRLLFVIFIFPFLLNAQDFPIKPSNYITDEANVLSDEQELALNSKLRSFEDSSTNQIFIYIASSLNGKDLSSYSQDIFHNWKIGQGDKNNGVLISIFINDHKFRIHTGYGLEGALPDIATKHIQDNDMRPLFKQNQYYEGIDKGIDQLMYYSKHEFKEIESSVEEESTAGLFIFFYAFSAAFLLVILLLTRKINDRPTAKKILIILSIIFFIIPFLGAFLLLIMIFVALSYRKDLLKTSGTSNWTSSSGSSWSSNDSSSSSWSSSDSDSGSSFDGGGGGDSGGGGSSSDW